MKKVIWIFYGFQFSFSMLMWLPIFYEYQKQIGLNDQQIFGIQSVYYLAFCLLEIPTGVLADRFGYRRCLIWGAGFLVVSNLLPIFAQNYRGFLYHFLLIALARSLISGASSAYIYDYLHRANALGVYKQIEGNARAYSLFGKVACWAAVGPLMAFHHTLPYWLTAGFATVSVFMALALPNLSEDVHQASLTFKKAVAADFSQWSLRFKEVTRQLVKSPFLIFLMVQGVSVFVLARITQVNLFQPILESKNFSLSSFGLIMSLMTLFEAFGSLKPSVLNRYISDLNAVYLLTIVMAVSLCLLLVSNKLGVLIFLCTFSLATGLSYPIQRQLMNEAIPDSKYRATLLSLESIVDRGANAALAAMIGSYLSQGRLKEFLMWCGGLSLVLVILLYAVGSTSLFSKERKPA